MSTSTSPDDRGPVSADPGRPPPGPAAEETAPETAPSRRPARAVLLIVVALIAGILFWTSASDHYAPGTSRGIVSANVAQVAPRVSGRVIAVDTEDNAILEAGAALFRLDPRPFEIAAETARARLAQVAQGVEASSAQIEAAQAQVAQARVGVENARTTAERTASLFDRGIASEAAQQQAQNALETAQAALEAAEATAESARQQLGAVGEDNPQVRAAELALEQAEYDLLSTTVMAPSYGVVTNLHLAVGQYVNAGATGVTFINADAVWITADLRENQLVNVEAGDPATLVFDAVPGRVFEGRVESLGWGINPGRTEVGGLPVNMPATQWFEPARKMPVRIVLEGGMENWPNQVRLGGKVGVLIHPDEGSHGVTRAAALFQRLGGRLSSFY